jgi:hypothetical protein
LLPTLSRIVANDAPGADARTRGIRIANPRAVVVLTIMLGLAVHAGTALFFGLTYNESYVAVASRHLELGYVDHPPLMMWLVAAMRFLTGSETGLIVRLPSILLFAATTWLVYEIGRAFFGDRAGAYGAIALNLSPVFGLFIGGLAITDAPMLFFVVLSAYLLQQAMFGASNRAAWWYWLGAGICTGLGMLAKYNAAFLPAGAALFLLTQPAYRRWLWHPAPYIAALACVLVFSPVLLWNAQHEWISLTFQGSRALPEGGVKVDRLLAYLGVQAAVTLPWIWIALIALLFMGLRAGPQDAPRWFLCCLAIGPILFFALVRLSANRADRGFHWAAPGYVMLFPLLGAAIDNWMANHAQRIRSWLVASVVTLAVLLSVMISHSLTGWVRLLHPSFAQREPLLLDLLDWNDLDSYLRNRGLVNAGTFVAAHRWRDCARIDYALHGKVPLLCLTDTPLQFSFFEDQSAVLNKDAVVVSSDWTLADARAAFGAYFSAIEPMPSITLGQFGLPIMRLNLFAGRNFHREFAWPYGRHVQLPEHNGPRKP